MVSKGGIIRKTPTELAVWVIRLKMMSLLQNQKQFYHQSAIFGEDLQVIHNGFESLCIHYYTVQCVLKHICT